MHTIYRHVCRCRRLLAKRHTLIDTHSRPRYFVRAGALGDPDAPCQQTMKLPPGPPPSRGERAIFTKEAKRCDPTHMSKQGCGCMLKTRISRLARRTDRSFSRPLCIDGPGGEGATYPQRVLLGRLSH